MVKKWVLLTVLLFTLTPVHAQTPDPQCDIPAYTDQLIEDLTALSEVSADTDADDAAGVGMAYLEVLALREAYEDQTVCADLAPLRELSIRAMSQLGDTLFLSMAAIADPDQQGIYQTTFNEGVGVRSGETLDQLLEELDRLTAQ